MHRGSVLIENGLQPLRNKNNVVVKPKAFMAVTSSIMYTFLLEDAIFKPR
jgi:hypothetical protein